MKPNLLILEDHPVQQKLYRIICERFGFDCRIFNRCGEVVNLLEQDGIGFDICIADWSLDGENGLDCIKKIRMMNKQKHRRGLPIVVVTAHAMVGDRELVKQAGADDYLAKPFTLDQFYEVVTRWVNASRHGVWLEDSNKLFDAEGHMRYREQEQQEKYGT